MTVRRTKTTDIDAVMSVIEEARRTIAALGIDQWQNGSPNRDMIAEDVALEQGYCVEANGKIVGTFALLEHGEPVYDEILDGAWLTADKQTDGSYAYLAIHRVAVAVAARGTGVSTAMMDYAAEVARAQGRNSLRIDTHRGNVVMRRMLEKHGFVHCGTVYLTGGDERVAYERVL